MENLEVYLVPTKLEKRLRRTELDLIICQRSIKFLAFGIIILSVLSIGHSMDNDMNRKKIQELQNKAG